MNEQQLAAMRLALEALEPALEALVNLCNNSAFYSTLDEVIAAEAALERLYKSRAAIEQAEPQEGRNWSLLEATQASLREHMAEVFRLRAMLAIQPSPTSEGFSACDMATAAAQGFRDGEDAAKREWVGLTDEEIIEAWPTLIPPRNATEIVRAIAAKLREKNTQKGN